MAARKASKILLTGGGGFIGSHVALALLNRGDSIVVIDEMNDYYDLAMKEENLRLLREHPRAQSEAGAFVFYQKSVEDAASMSEIFDREQPEVVCHLAARAGVRHSIEQPLVYVDANVRGTVVLLEETRKRPGIRNFVYASSSSVYGSRAEDESGFRETDSVDEAASPYAATKRCCEILAHTYAHLHRFPAIGLRFFTVYGPRGRPDMAPFIFVSKIHQGKPIQQFGDGTAKRDFTFVDDIVAGVLGALDLHSQLPRLPSHQVFNLGKGVTTSLSDFIQLVESAVGKKAIIEVLPPQPGDVPFTLANVDAARAAFGYSPSTPPSVGIPKFVEWYLQFEERKKAQAQAPPQ